MSDVMTEPIANGYLRLDREEWVWAVDKPPLEARKTGVSAVSDLETDATRRRGCDEHDPAVIRNPDRSSDRVASRSGRYSTTIV